MKRLFTGLTWMLVFAGATIAQAGHWKVGGALMLAAIVTGKCADILNAARAEP